MCPKISQAIINPSFFSPDKRGRGGRHICAKLFQLWQPLLRFSRLQWSLSEAEVLHKVKLLLFKDMWLGKCLLQESTESKIHPQLIYPKLVQSAKTYIQHNCSTKEKNNTET